MSKLGNFLGQSKKIQIKEQELELFPLKVKDLKKFNGMEKASVEEQEKLTYDMIRLSLRDETITNDEIGSMPIEIFKQLTNEIMEFNGMKDERVESIKEKIAQARNK